MTSLAWRESPETQATASVARCHASWWSTSATEISKRWRSLSLRPFRTCRLPLSEPTSGRCSSTVPTATRAADMLEGPRDLFRRKGLDDVAGLHPLDPLDPDAALEPLQHLTDIVLEALERADGVLAKHGLAPLDAHPRGTDDLPLDHGAAEDRSDLGDGEELLHLRTAVNGLADLRREHAAERRLDVVEDVVDDAVVPEVDAVGLGLARCLGLGLDVEGEHDGVGRRGERDVRFGDGADRAVDHVAPDFL